MTDPAYRFNEKISIYGMIGWSHTKVEIYTNWLDHESGNYVNQDSGSQSKDNVGYYGIGLQINPTKNIAIDIGYEGAQSSNAKDNKKMNAFNIGAGYKF